MTANFGFTILFNHFITFIALVESLKVTSASKII